MPSLLFFCPLASVALLFVRSVFHQHCCSFSCPCCLLRLYETRNSPNTHPAPSHYPPHPLGQSASRARRQTLSDVPLDYCCFAWTLALTHSLEALWPQSESPSLSKSRPVVAPRCTSFGPQDCWRRKTWDDQLPGRQKRPTPSEATAEAAAAASMQLTTATAESKWVSWAGTSSIYFGVLFSRGWDVWTFSVENWGTDRRNRTRKPATGTNERINGCRKLRSFSPSKIPVPAASAAVLSISLAAVRKRSVA